MLRIGIIGMGFMGRMHFKNWCAQEGVSVTAVCDAAPIDTSATSGNIDTGDDLVLDNVAVFQDIGEMLESEELDAVSITLPTFLHRDISIQCLNAGVHVLCEKPMALNLEDCDAMIVAANNAGRHLMVAHCIRFWPEYAYIKEVADSGQFGEIKAAELSRLSIPPGWGAGSWFSDTRKSGGIALDLHIHDLDFVQYLFGCPDRVNPLIAESNPGLPAHLVTQLDYENGPAVSVTASWMMPQSFGFQMSFKFVFENALAVFDGKELTVFPEKGDPFVPKLPDEDGYLAEIRYFRDLIKGKITREVITPVQARESVGLALKAIAK